jgi:hypothetical protein
MGRFALGLMVHRGAKTCSDLELDIMESIGGPYEPLETTFPSFIIVLQIQISNDTTFSNHKLQTFCSVMSLQRN